MHPAPPRSDEPAEPGQAVCPHCGALLSGDGAGAAHSAHRLRARDVIWAAFVLALAAAAGAAIALSARDARRSAAPSLITTGISAAPPTTPATETDPPPAAKWRSAILTWPAGRSGYTDVLVALPESVGRAAAVRRAHDAADASLPDVGVLLSSRHSTLPAGFWIVFSGRFATMAAARAALPSARAHGFPEAHTARIAP
jgi:hypothetical protein